MAEKMRRPSTLETIVYCTEPADQCAACRMPAARDYCRPEVWQRIYAERRAAVVDAIARQARQAWGREPRREVAA